MNLKQKHYLWLAVEGEDTWYSTQQLIANLERCYQDKLGSQFLKVSLPRDIDQLQKIISENPITSVIIASPRINLFTIMKYINSIVDIKLEYLIHVIGSPVQKLEELKKMKMENERVSLLAGSRVNYEILKKYCVGDVKYFPFVAESLNEIQARDFKIKNKFIYFGRISYQKNVVALLDLFAKYQKTRNSEAELSIYGAACNTNFPTKPTGHYIGYTPELFFEKLAKLQAQGHRIQYYGLATQSELKKSLLNHNTFVSLSTAEEEDFGMSAFESLSSGLSCVLSHWGGHKEFQNIPEVGLVPIVHQDNSLCLDEELFFDLLDEYNVCQEVDLQPWLLERKKKINDLNLNLEFESLGINIDVKIRKEEFFNEYKEFVSPYWR